MLPPFVSDMIVCTEFKEIYKKLQELKSEFRNLEYKINIQKSIMFLNVNNENVETKVI